MQSLSATNTQSWLVWFLKGILLLGIVVLLARLVELQIIKGDYFHVLAEENRIRRIPIKAPRGLILARGGEILVENKELPQKESTEVFVPTIRNYLLKEDFAHAGGTIGQVKAEEVGKVSPDCIEKGAFASSDWVGRGGLEEQYNCFLRGVDGEKLIEVDTQGAEVRTIGTKDPVPGENLQTTIEYKLQKKVAEVLKTEGKKAAAVVSDGKGEILAFYSHPSYDPNAFLQQTDEDKKKVTSYFRDPQMPLFNRVIGGAYHPGSIFKIVTAAAGLEDKKISRQFSYNDTGVVTVNEFSYANWYFTQYGGVEGEIDLARALARSTDTYFYKVGEFVGAQQLAQWANSFGMGNLTGIDLPGEIGGLVPTPEWKKQAKNENWFLGNTYHMAIGQGDLATTVLEGNVMTSVIASDGLLCKPHLNKNVDPKCEKVNLATDTIKYIKEGLIAACSTGGTAFPFFDFPMQAACKTGTAETEEEDKTHAWFTVMAPASDPQIVVTILVEKAGEGSSVAAPLARTILDFWNLQQNP